MAENLNKLIRNRGVIKGQLTRLHTYLSTEQEFDVDDLKARKEKLEEYNHSFLEQQLSIEESQSKTSSDSNNLEIEFEAERTSFEQCYFQCLKLINKGLRELSVDAAGSGHRTNSNYCQTNAKQITSLLPKIEIPAFDGTPIKWHAFHDSFKSLVHNNDNLLGIEKYHLLKNSLCGDAADLISSTNASEEGYIVAWELLIQRFDKPRRIIQAHLKSLLELPEIIKDSPTNIRTLLEKSQLHINGLKALKLDITNWDPFLVYIITSKLNKFTRRTWERSLENDDIPKYDELITFLKRHARGDELDINTTTDNKSKQKYSGTNNSNYNKRFFSHHISISHKCRICSNTHSIYVCDKFKSLHPRERYEAARVAELCINCLRDNHKTINCKSNGCKICGKKHNTLLHFESKVIATEVNSNSDKTQSVQVGEISKTAMTAAFESEVLLGTAIIKILDRDNKEHECRVLLDSGSQSNFITEKLANRLRLQKNNIEIPFLGIGKSSTRSQYYVTTQFISKTSHYKNTINFVALPEISGALPSRSVNRKEIVIPQNITLADPEFHKSQEIDALLGNKIYYELLQYGQIKLANGSIILQKTLVGWLVNGDANIAKSSNQAFPNSICLLTSFSLEKTLQNFWEIEELNKEKFHSDEEAACEAHFVNNVKRDETGRYIVRLPFKDEKFKLGSSFTLALKRFYALENKLAKDQILYKQYREFLDEYLKLGHMTNISHSDNLESGYYLPHHPIIKDASITTKVRVVFDASAKNANNVALNEVLMTGPTIQDDLFSIVCRFRLYKYVLTADIEKMYRQIRVDEQDVKYQKIVWRSSKDETIQIFQLNTITYGTTSAPFLAVRCLKQLAVDEGSNYPLAARVLLKDFYMDDLLTGCNNHEDAIILKNQLIELLKLGGFNLRQWASNDKSLLENNCATDYSLNFDVKSESKKILGVHWNPTDDTIYYCTKNFMQEHNSLTKRTILSEIAQLFDPLGLVNPVIVKAKIMMQELWKLKLDWDESVPQSIGTEWNNLKKQLIYLNNFQIPRKITIDDHKNLQLHGFCDASERAYGACIYVRSQNNNNYSTVLVCAKSRVAPVKTISLPRLELCAAVLLVNLYEKTISSLNINFDLVRFWSDSNIVLNWLNKPPYLWETFVANRVAIIQRVTNSENWHHISSNDNPADIVSRGQMPCDLVNNQLWLHGPHWFTSEEAEWPINPVIALEVPEKRNRIALVSTSITESDNIFKRFSSIKKLNRVIAICLRWASNYKSKNKVVGELSNEEIYNAQNRVIKLTQMQYFPEDLHALGQDKSICSKSKILPLAPFIDEKGLIRVGGRLQKSQLDYANKHPILLPKATLRKKIS